MEREDFVLDKIRDGVKRRAEELAGSDNARVRSYDDFSNDDEGPFKPFTYSETDYNRTEPDKDDMRKYWRQFETTPFVRKSITSFSRQVMEPGYYIQAQGLSEDQLVEIDKWLSEAAIIEGEPGQDFRQLAKKAIVQQEVRGTAFVEKAPDRDDDEKVAGLKLINAETMEAVTKPGQSVLLRPEDIDEYEDAPEAESGGAAAWLQDLGDTNALYSRSVRKIGQRRGRDRGRLQNDDGDADNDFKIGFTRDEIIPLRRDADVGELFGTSRLEAVSGRIEGLRQKLCDNDEAIASKAYPLWLFLFGSEDNPWEANDIDQFMKSHEMDNFHPGMKQGVRGDVSVETISGEVADIAEALQFDINWIMSVMPVPMYMLGSFLENSAVGQLGGIAQQQETQRQIKDTRRDIEDKFTPLVQQVAMQQGVPEEEAKSIRLKVGSPGEPETEVPQRENIIRYVPKDQRDPTSPNPDQQSPGSDGIPTGLPDGESPLNVDNPTMDSPGQDGGVESASGRVWYDGASIEELSLHGDTGLSETIFEKMTRTRDDTLERVEQQYADSPYYAASNFERIANSVLREQLSRHGFRDDVSPVVEELLIGDEPSFRRSNSVKFYTQNIENAVEDALEEMLRLMRVQVRRGVNNGESLDNVVNRVRNEYNDAKLRQRAELIAHMERTEIVESEKLQQFESDPDVIGVRISNENPSTPLTQSLSGEVLYFEDGDLQAQLMEHTREEFLHKGFDPLPPTPPFHFNDTTTFEPVYDETKSS